MRHLPFAFSFALTIQNRTPTVAVPNCASVFIDPHWEGTFCTDSKTIPDANAVAFLVRLRLVPIPRTTLQKLRLGDNADTNTMCNSVKVHFFNRHGSSLDFLYSTAFPIESLLNNRQGYFDTFNYNAGDLTCSPLDGVTVRIVPLACAVDMAFRTKTVMLCVDCPATLHGHTMALSNWLERAVETLAPSSTCLFKRMSTFGRDRCSMVLFQDLHILLGTKASSHGSYLPPALAIYAICNAALVNRISLAAITAAADVGKVLDVMRDTCACFTMCHHEGVYWPDKSCGTDVQDQPHPFSSVEDCGDARVFGRDDCEGRAAQTQVIVGLLKSMASVCRPPRSNYERLCELLKGQQTAIKIPLRLCDATLRAALSACIFLGEKLLSKGYELHTTVGNSCFNQVASQHKVLTGHSFSIATDKDKNHRIVDSTGWERLSLNPAQDITDSVPILTDLYREFAGHAVQRCIAVNADHENDMYCRMAVGHDHIYFSFNDSTLEFGTTIGSMRSNGLRTATTAAESSPSFRIKTRDFIRELCDDRKGESKWPNAKHVNGADKLIKIYDYMQERMPEICRVTRPPPVSEDHILATMNATWAIMDDVTMSTLDTIRASSSCYRFSLSQSSTPVFNAVEAHFSSGKYFACRSYGFMKSKIFMVFQDQ